VADMPAHFEPIPRAMLAGDFNIRPHLLHLGFPSIIEPPKKNTPAQALRLGWCRFRTMRFGFALPALSEAD